MRVVLFILLAFLGASKLDAQNNAQGPLVVPFTTVPPFQYFKEDGQRTGFIFELAELIGAEIGVPIRYLDVANSREWVAVQAAGASHMIPGVSQLPALAASNVFSKEVAIDELRPTVLARNVDVLESGTLTNMRVAIVPPAVGSQEPVLEQNTPIAYESPQAALMELLAGHVDAILLPPAVVYDLARDANVDGRIAFMGPPMRRTLRHVALHESRADLLKPINEAITRLDNDGRLDALRRRYNLTVPPSPPDVLQIGVTHLPPLSTIEEDGTFSGFNVDVTKAIAERGGLAFELVPLPLTDWVKGPAANGLDAISALVINDARREVMDFTYPILERQAAVIIDAEEDVDARKIADLRGQRAGAIEGSIFARRALASGVTSLVGYQTTEDVIAALLAGEIDIALHAPNVVGDVIERENLADRLQIVPLSDEQIDTSIALRPGLGAVREQLDAVIPGYLLSDEYASLRQTYFGKPVFWTQSRIYGAIASVAAAFAILLGFLIWQRQRQSRQEIERQAVTLKKEKAHSEELSKLVAELERSNRELDDFVYIASHDLKEPLRGIGINANFLMREELPGKSGERIVRMGQLAGRMEKLISDLLFLSRLGRSAEEPAEINPSDVIADIRSDLAEWLTERGGEIVEICELPSLKADQVKVKIVLQNLIVNGIKYNDADRKRVEIGFAPRAEVNGRVIENVIFVKDNGIGIGAEYRDKIFRIFSRLNKDEDYGPGTGSGLAFVRKIVEEYGGVVDFNSQRGTGSTFHIVLPLAHPTA